jgi:general secretion pathway protein D
MKVLPRLLGAFAVAITLFGCAADRMHSHGLDLVDHGQDEAGLAQLEAAAKEAPNNLEFHSDLIQKRYQVLNRMLSNADAERAAGHAEQARQIYQRVLRIESNNARAHDGIAGLDLDLRHATTLAQVQALLDKHDYDTAQGLLRGILLENPERAEARALQRKLDEKIAHDALAGPMLRPEFRKPVTLQFRDANIKMVVEALARTNGINILLDKDVRADLKTTIFVKDAAVEDTLDLILLQNQLEKKILSDNTVLVYPNNPAKIKEYQDLKIRSFQLVNADAKQMQVMLKTLLKVRDLYVDEKTNSIVMRDTPDAVRLAEKLIAAQDLPDPEVMLEVEVLEVSHARLTELGIKLPQQIVMSTGGTPATTTVNNLPGGGVVTTTTPDIPLTLSTLKNISGSDINVAPLTASLDLRRETGDTNILASPRIRVRNREKAKILIGDRVPVITNQVTPVSTGAPVVTGTVQYLDVGLKLDVEPDIHLDDDVHIKVNLEVSNIVREVSSGPTLAYQIGTRSANTVLRLKDGETQVLAGLISDEDRKTAQKFPGLGDLPILGRLFSSHKDDGRKTEIVLSITPHLTRPSQRPDATNVEFWSGTDTNLRSRTLNLQPTSTAPAEAKGIGEARAVADKPADAAAPATTANPLVPVAVPALVPAVPPAAVPSAASPVAGPPLVLSWEGPNQARVGKEFSISVHADTTLALGTLSFRVDYDPVAMKIVRVTEGGLLKQNDKKTIFTDMVDQNSGHVFVQVARVGTAGATGKGSVAQLTFLARTATAQSPLVITSPTPVSSDGKTLALTQPGPFVITLSPAP